MAEKNVNESVEEKVEKKKAKKKEPRLKIDHRAKTITMYEKVFENKTKEEEERIDKYLLIGYEVKVKPNPKRNSLTDDDIIAGIKDEAALKTYKDMKKEKGFFAAKAWYTKEYKKNK